MKLKFLKIIIFLIAFLYVINFVSANLGYYTKDTSLKQCRCSELNDLLKIKNTGSENTIYTITSNLNFVEITPFKFELQSNEVQDVNLLIKAPCESFEKTLKLKIKSNKGDNEVISKELQFGQCKNLQAQLFVESSEINPCEPNIYKLKIKNSGPFVENYSISSNQDNLNFTLNEVEIFPGGVSTVNATLNLDCSVYGEVPVSFEILAENNQLKSTLTHNLNVTRNYDYSIDVDSENDFCIEEVEPIIVKIKNEVNTPNIYYFKLENAPNFISLSANNVSFEDKYNSEINILLNPKSEKDVGEYNFILKSWSEYGDLVIDKNISVVLSDCYDLNVVLPEDSFEFCSGKQDVVVSINNLAEKRTSFVLSAEPEWVNFDVKRVSIDSNSNYDATLEFDMPDKDETYNFSVTATIAGKEFSKSDYATIKVDSSWICNQIVVDKTRYSMIRDLGNWLFVDLKNNGFFENEYKLSVKPDNMFHVDNSRITLASGEQKKILLISNHNQDTSFGEYNFNLTISLNGLEYVYPIIINLKDKPVYMKAYDYFSKYPCHAVTTIFVVTIIVLALIFPYIKKKKYSLKKNWFIGMIVILLIILVLFASLIYFYKGVPKFYESINYSNVSSAHYIWPQNTNYELNINDFVTDPDIGDEFKLSFSKKPEHVNLSVKKNKVLFIPENNWFGVETAIIKAKDSKGSFSLSPEITFEVFKRDKLTLFKIYNELCWYINWLLLTVIFILLSLIGYKKLRVKKSKRR